MRYFTNFTHRQCVILHNQEHVLFLNSFKTVLVAASFSIARKRLAAPPIRYTSLSGI